MTAQAKKMVEMIAESYIKVMGIQKWNNLTNEEKHNAIMIIAKDILKAI